MLECFLLVFPLLNTPKVYGAVGTDAGMFSVSLSSVLLEVVITVVLVAFPRWSIDLEIVTIAILIIQEIVFVHTDAVVVYR